MGGASSCAGAAQQHVLGRWPFRRASCYWKPWKVSGPEAASRCLGQSRRDHQSRALSRTAAGTATAPETTVLSSLRPSVVWQRSASLVALRPGFSSSGQQLLAIAAPPASPALGPPSLLPSLSHTRFARPCFAACRSTPRRGLRRAPGEDKVNDGQCLSFQHSMGA
eukprot:scaffold61382_cov67-Phaeocystis_antarctica.AAC.3